MGRQAVLVINRQPNRKWQFGTTFGISNRTCRGSVCRTSPGVETTTNQLGLFSLAVGGGTVLSGTFANINWGTGDKYLQVEMDPAGGTAYTNMGTSQLLSVPYALFAKSATVQTSNLLSGNGTPGNALTIASPSLNYRSLVTNGSSNVQWDIRGGYLIGMSGGLTATTTPWDILDFSATQYGQNCINCKVVIRFYSPVSRTLYVRAPNDPNPVENVYDITAGRSITVTVDAINGKFEYYSNTGGLLKYEFIGFFQ